MLENEPMPDEVIDLAGRSLPQNLEAERSVLGGLLLAPDRFSMIDGKISSDDFFNQAYGNVFQVMSELNAKGLALDVLVLKDELQKQGFLEMAGGAAGIAALMDAVPTGAHVEYYAQIVREKATLRRLNSTATTIVQMVAENKSSPSDIIDEAERAIFEVAERGTSGEADSITDVLKQTWKKIEEYQSSQRTVTGVPTDFMELDSLTSGMHEGELIIVAARPSMGKSTFALNVARRVAVDHHMPTVFYSLEMSSMNIAQNLLCAHARVDAQRLRTGKLSDEDWTHLGRSTEALSQAPMFIDETAGISLSELRGKTRRLKARHGLKLCVIDYLQLMTASSRSANRSREQEVSEISRGLKALAKELAIPVIALSQLSRKTADRKDNRPILSDLRESGAIEQDADVVMLIHRPDYYDKEDHPGEAEIIVAKQRNGPTDTVNLAFIGNQLRFENLSVGRSPESDEEI